MEDKTRSTCPNRLLGGQAAECLSAPSHERKYPRLDERNGVLAVAQGFSTWLGLTYGGKPDDRCAYHASSTPVFALPRGSRSNDILSAERVRDDLIAASPNKRWLCLRRSPMPVAPSSSDEVFVGSDPLYKVDLPRISGARRHRMPKRTDRGGCSRSDHQPKVPAGRRAKGLEMGNSCTFASRHPAPHFHAPKSSRRG